MNREGFALPNTLPTLNNPLYSKHDSLDGADYLRGHLPVQYE